MAENSQTAVRFRFLCDRMLARFCRRLRAAGYDTEIAGPTEQDRGLLQRAVDENRLLLTCDRGIAERRLASGRVIVLPANGLEETARALMESVSVDWLHDPFSRCLMDNARVRPAAPSEFHRLPQRVREIGSMEVFVCPHCDRIYWPGSHVRRMSQQLHAWQTMADANRG